MQQGTTTEKPKPKVVFSMRIEPDLLDALKRLSERRGVSTSELIRTMIGSS